MAKNIGCFTLIHLCFFISFVSKAQVPPNNFQCRPDVIGMLPQAPPCGTSGASINYGATVTKSGTTVGATNDSLSGAITSCYSNSSPLKDVWYQFTASETYVEIIITGQGSAPLEDPYIGIYESANNECVGLIPRDCSAAVPGLDADTMTFGPLTYGVKYYLQVASSNVIGNGAFRLDIKSKSICSDCLRNSLLQSYPLPVQAAYPPDTVIGFCYSVIGYKELFGNRLHGVVPSFGNGWDVTSFKVQSVADSADFKGEWKYFKNLNVKGSIVSGFFYDVGNDNDPTNNLGDKGSTTTVWTFCFTIRTKTKAACDAGQDDLSISFNTYSDGESGSLITSKDCSGDSDYKFKAHMNCCPRPSIGLVANASCDKSKDGKIIAYGGNVFLGYTYELFNSLGVKIDKLFIPPGTTAYTNNVLNKGNYYLYISSQSCITAMNIYVPGPVLYTMQQTSFGCGTGCNNSARVTVTSGNVVSHKWNNGFIGANPTNLCPGMNYDTMRVAFPSTCKMVDSIFIFNLPVSNATFKYSKKNYCTADQSATIANFPPTAGGTFSIALDSTNGASIDPGTGTIPLSTITKSGRILVKYTTGPPCNAVGTDTIYIQVSPPPVNIYSDHYFCSGNSNSPFINTSSYTIKWYSDSTLTNLKFTQAPKQSYDPMGGSFPPAGTTTYYLTQVPVTTSICQSSPVTIKIIVSATPMVNTGPSTTICPGFGVTLTASGASSYSWQPINSLDNATLASPIASPASTTQYTVTGTDANGCSASDTVTVYVSANGKCNLIIYNGFTPNGDNHNDYWHIDGIGADDKNEVAIFNRWGEKIWETKHYDNLNNKWEGQGPNGRVPDGTYFYVIQYKGETLKGWVELTR